MNESTLTELLSLAQEADRLLPDLKRAADEAQREHRRAEAEAVNRWNAFHKALKAQDGAVRQSNIFADEQRKAMVPC